MYSVDFRFLSTSQNSPLFLAHYIPEIGNSASSKKAVVFVPPFAEELNRSKRMFVLCARQLASAGVESVCFDYVGTGDSHGDWGSFDLADWEANLIGVCEYLHDLGVKDISLVALRFGALVAANVIAAGDIRVNKCVFWDPVENGEVYIRQLIRLKIAAAMAEQAQKISTKDVLASIEEHGFVEIAGYSLTGPLIDSIKATKLADTIETVSDLTKLHWISLSGKNQTSEHSTLPVSVPSKLADQVSMHRVNDTRFWMQQEVTIAPILLQQTTELFTDAE